MTGPRATPLPASFAFTVERDGTGYADVRSKADGRLVAKAPDGDMAREIVRRWNAHADLRDALAALLAEAEGPAMVWGDGRGRDGTKTGLSHEEFCAQRKSRIETARALLARIDGGELVARPPDDQGERRSSWDLKEGGDRG